MPQVAAVLVSRQIPHEHYTIDQCSKYGHPNFGSPVNYLSSLLFGQQTLNNFLGSGGQRGGLNLLDQIGGPRSVQLELKLQF